MQPNKVYEKLLDELTKGELSDLQRKVFGLLKDNPNGLTRDDLVYRIYGYSPDTLDGNTDDRKIRKAIQRLRERLVPIVSTSGKPGYRLDVSREAVNQMLAELRSRRDHLDQQIRAASKFYEIPAAYQEDTQEANQLEFVL